MVAFEAAGPIRLDNFAGYLHEAPAPVLISRNRSLPSL